MRYLVGPRGAGGRDPRALDRLLAFRHRRLHGGRAGKRTAEAGLALRPPNRPLVGAFLLLAALDHALVALPPCRARYERGLAAGVNPFRWLEYSLSASLMVVLIAMLTGIADYVVLFTLFAANAAMIFLGWLMELLNPPARARTRWLPFVLGCIVGVVAWIAIAVQIGVSADRGHPPPTFVYAIFVSLFVLFNSFAVNQALQYKRVGRWRDYRYGERWYLWLSLVAKSLLAWQVFANVLVL